MENSDEVKRRKRGKEIQDRLYRKRGLTTHKHLSLLFGDVTEDIRQKFLSLNMPELNHVLADYGAIYGEAAERYARKTYPMWVSGSTSLSGQTLERLIELVPRHLDSEARKALLFKLLQKYSKNEFPSLIRINSQEPEEGFVQLEQALNKIRSNESLARLPEWVMSYATWLYNDDITILRAVTAEIQNSETVMLKRKAIEQVGLLKKAVRNGEITSAEYNLKTPNGDLKLIIYEPSKCFVASVCFGSDSPEVTTLRLWRDEVLSSTVFGRNFILWYYKYGPTIARFTKTNKVLKAILKGGIVMVVRMLNSQRQRHSGE
ncbi:hypothetical protein J6I92_08160 [Pseudidiomarina sp. 1APR75-15]|uniref:Uncharacterized protein n=1 Tax=Pseudidiomarina terrestris TaxID=2820060 RepID=A0ABT8MIU2_9GAMM|nr:CFI-box-CTERM domain-containing protein [Pseudidiomarina sp. 1APR75-15]MDN7129843.1 hypothetical protein [Pseudidiomarina sp. 1APR75-15]